MRARGYDNVIAVSELEAGDVLASGIAGIADYEDVAVCIVEPDAAVVAIVNSEGVTVDRFGRPSDGSDVVELPSSVMAMLELDDWRPDSIFVVGSAEDLDLIKTTLEAVTDAPVFSAAEADLALARGAALASARAVNGLETTETHKPSRVRALTALLVAAAVTLVVSLSVALGLSLSPSVPEQPQRREPRARGRGAATTGHAIRDQGREPHRVTEGGPPRSGADHRGRRSARARIRATGRARQRAARLQHRPYQHRPMPPAPPAYVPPVAPQPRLRDRIIERIPIINRFHEPEYQQPR